MLIVVVGAIVLSNVASLIFRPRYSKVVAHSYFVWLLLNRGE